MSRNHSKHWCNPNTRLAIYLRDGLACAWCGLSLERGAVLTLDHLVPKDKGGSNAATNLVTCCHRCNSVRKIRSVPQFAADVAVYLGNVDLAKDIIAHIARCRRRVLPRQEAREMVARRGSVAQVLASWGEEV